MVTGNPVHLINLHNMEWAIQPETLESFSDVFINYLNTGESIPKMESSPTGICLERLKAGVFCLHIEGTLVPRAFGIDAMCGLIGMNQITEALHEMYNDREIETLVIKVNSGGGTITGTEELANAIAKAPFNTVAFIDELCASAAYWIASSADKVVCTPSSLIGSIGVYSSRIEKTKDESSQYKRTFFQAGAKKLWGSKDTVMSHEERTDTQNRVDNLYERFTGYVAKQRKTSQDLVKQTEAGVYYAFNAPEWMYDYLMDYSDFMEQL